MKKDTWKNKLFYGDNLEVLRKYIESNSVDLCYIDPPFNSKKQYFQIYLNQGSEDKAQAQAFIDTWNWGDRADNEFDELMSNEKNLCSIQLIELIEGLKKVLGKSSLLAYLISMSLRILEIHRVLKSSGSFYLHCDPTASHYLKLILDSIFCAKGGNFQNEIIWCYTAPSKVANYFPRKHDVIFFYTKSESKKLNFDDIRVPYSKESLSRANRDVIKKGGTIYNHVELNELGKIPEDWWSDIVPASRKPGERLGYPTQKPEQLLERIIKANTNKGDLILDCYCGCGTTIAVAQKLKRKWIGIDITFQSISLVLERLEDSFGSKIIPNIILDGVPKDFESAEALAHKEDDRIRKEFEKWAILSYSNNKAMIHDKKGKDYGIDGEILMSDYKGKDDNTTELKKVYFSVKSDKKPHVSYIHAFHGVIKRDKAAFGIFITLYEPTKDMKDECKKLGYYQCNIIDKKYPIVKIVSITDYFDKNERLEIPIGHQKNVIKKAKLKKVKDSETQYKMNL